MLSPSVENVLTVYSNSDGEDIREGLNWYRAAHRFAKTLDPNNVARASGIIAALSPRSPWENNKSKAAQLYRQGGDGTGIGLLRNVRKAIRIYNGESPEDVLRGNKVTAFYQTIFNPTGDVTPVIDRHAFDVAVGQKTDNEARRILERKGVYARFANVYREAARIAGIGSAQMQAITWLTWRRY